MNKIKFKSIKKKKEGYKYGCLIIYLNISKWNDILSLIKQEDIYEPNSFKYGLENDPHITLVFGFKKDENLIEFIKKINLEKIEKELEYEDKFSIFENGEYDVVKIKVNCKYLTKLNKELNDSYSIYNEYGEYKPHLTASYVKQNKGKEYDGVIIPKFNFKVSKIVHSTISGYKHSFYI